jgi:hypothetical protein
VSATVVEPAAELLVDGGVVKQVEVVGTAEVAVVVEVEPQPFGSPAL